MNTETSTSVTITRVFNASPARVWQAWSTAEGLRQWACPEGATVADTSVDLKVGGRYCIRIGGEEGETFTAVGEYREVSPQTRLVYTWDWEEADHAVGETLVSVDFAPVGGSTRVTLVHDRFPNAEAAIAHEQGWGSCLNQLEAALRTPLP